MSIFSRSISTLSLVTLFVTGMMTTANAFSLKFLGSRDAAGSSKFFDFEFLVEASQSIKDSDKLVIGGFDSIEGLFLEDPIDSNAFPTVGNWFGSAVSVNQKEATFTSISTITSGANGMTFQTFTVQADDVPSGFVNSSFDGSNLGPTPVPEPITIVGSLAALGYGLYAQKTFGIKQKN